MASWEEWKEKYCSQEFPNSLSEIDTKELKLEVMKREAELDNLKEKLDRLQDEFQQLENSVEGTDISDSTKEKADKLEKRFGWRQDDFEDIVNELILLESFRVLKKQFNTKEATSLEDLSQSETLQIREATIDIIKGKPTIAEYQSVLNYELDSETININTESKTDIENIIIDTEDTKDDPAIGIEEQISHTVDSVLELSD